MTEESNDLLIKIQLSFDNQFKEKGKVVEEISKWIAEQLSDEHDATVIAKSIEEREALGTTGFGDGFAIPHGKVPTLSQPALVIIRLKKPIDWDAMDEAPVDHLLLILVPEEKANQTHLKLLSTLAYHLMDEQTKQRLKTIKTSDEMLAFINELFEKGR